MTRKIIHLDLDAFFCAVEALRDPSLHGKAFAVGGRPEHRGVIASCSYPARKFGVRSAMPTARALLLCPTLIVISGHHTDYSEYSRQVMSHLYNFAHHVEQISIDEAFLDVSDLRALGERTARELQSTIWQDLQLPCSLGVATNKLVAKIANNVGKASARSTGPPMAIKVVPPGEESAFLAPLPITELWGVGPKTAESLEQLGIRTIGDLAGWPVEDLTQRFGKHGADLARRARGIDDRPVAAEQGMKSISQETTFAQDVTDEAELKRTLTHLSENVGRRLRNAELNAATIKIKLRWSDFTTVTRQLTLPESTDQDTVIYGAALKLLMDNWRPGKPVRLIGVGTSNLAEPMAQLRLWDTSNEKGQKLQQTLDSLRDRFGRDAIQRAFVIKPPGRHLTNLKHDHTTERDMIRMKMKQSPPKAILLDFYGTLVEEDDAHIQKICGEIADVAQVDPGEIGAFWSEAFHSMCERSYGQSYRLQKDIARVSLEGVLKAYEVDLDADELSRPQFAYWMRPQVYPETLDVISKIGVPICLLSNIDNVELCSALAHTGLEFRYIVTSEDCRSYKPRAEMFEAALVKLGLGKEDVLHVGDSISADVVGARRHGIKVMWINRKKRHIDASTQPDYISDNLTGILDILNR